MVKKSTIIRWITIIVFFFFAASNAFNLVSIKGLTEYDYVLTFVIGIVVAFSIWNSPSRKATMLSKYFRKYYTLAVVSLLILAGYTVITYREQSFYLTFRVVSQYLLMIWAVPIYYLMKRDGSFLRVMEIVNLLAVIWCIFVLAHSVYYSMRGNVLFSFVDSVVSGIRNDSLRISTGCLTNVALIYCFWKILNGKLKKNIYHIACFIIQGAALLYVMQSRAYTVAIAVTLCAMILFDRNDQRKFTRKMILTVAIAVVAFCTDLLQSYFINIFTRYQISVTARTYGYGYYWSVFLDNPIFGFGLLKDQAHYSSLYSGPLGIAYIDDVGIVGQFATLGIFCIPIVIGLYFFLFKTYFRAKKRYNDNTLMVGILTYLLATSATLVAFDQQRVCIMSLIVALFEFFAYNDGLGADKETSVSEG